MTPMDKKQRKIADQERPNAVCVRVNERGCAGNLEVSHPFGRRVQERWMWIWCCTRHHRGDLQNEQIGKLHAYQQATDETIRETFKKTGEQYVQEKKWLTSTYQDLL